MIGLGILIAMAVGLLVAVGQAVHADQAKGRAEAALKISQAERARLARYGVEQRERAERAEDQLRSQRLGTKPGHW